MQIECNEIEHCLEGGILVVGDTKIIFADYGYESMIFFLQLLIARRERCENKKFNVELIREKHG